MPNDGSADPRPNESRRNEPVQRTGVLSNNKKWLDTQTYTHRHIDTATRNWKAESKRQKKTRVEESKRKPIEIEAIHIFQKRKLCLRLSFFFGWLFCPESSSVLPWWWRRSRSSRHSRRVNWPSTNWSRWSIGSRVATEPSRPPSPSSCWAGPIRKPLTWFTPFSSSDSSWPTPSGARKFNGPTILVS